MVDVNGTSNIHEIDIRFNRFHFAARKLDVNLIV